MPELILNKTSTATTSLSDGAVKALKQIAERYELTGEVTLFESPHGHIAKLPLPDEHAGAVQPSSPWRVNRDDCRFFAALIGVRWFEFARGEITVALEA